MAREKKLSNSFSTGGGGAHFEEHVQSVYVVLMLTGGYAPCLPCWPISKIKLQRDTDEYNTDDFIVFVKDPGSQEQRKLLGQVKHSISITKGSSVFGEVMQAAWSDFNNSKFFNQGKDVIALITGPLTATDAHNVQWLLNQARHTENVGDFIRRVKQAKFSPSKSSEKLDAIKYHLKAANGGNDVSNDELYNFLNHFHLLGYDLGKEHGVVLSLLYSHISQFQQQYPKWVWSRVVDIVGTWNQDAGIVTPDNLPEDLKDAFRQKIVKAIPEELKGTREIPPTDWAQHPDAACLSLALLIGSWNEKNKNDVEEVTQFLGLSYEDWLKKAGKILQLPDTPLTLKNGIWKIDGRAKLLSLLGTRVFDQNLEIFKTLAVKVLSENDPAFELPPEKRYSASIHGKVLSYSGELRKGLAEGLAIIGSFPSEFSNCSQGKADSISCSALQAIVSDADWRRWGSLNSLLPPIAEANPGAFLDAVEHALRLTPSPFDELFSQEGNGITGRNYLTGLLWALEGLAWEEQYLVRVCVVLGELASHDPGGQWANRPANSLLTILLPWLPHTLASFEKREVAMRTLINEWPDVAWNLIIQLLPGQHQTSSGSYKPSWRKIIPADWEKGVTHQEYWEQASVYAELSVREAGHNTSRLSTLIDNFDKLPQSAFDQLIEVLSSKPISEISENQRLSIWNHLTKFTNHHRRYSDAKWALPEDLIGRIEAVAEKLAPIDPFNLHQHLFTDRDFDLYDESGDWEEQQKKLTARRENAISEVYQQMGVDGVIRFAESVASSRQVGHALGGLDDDVFEATFLPKFLTTENDNHKALVSSFISRRFYVKNGDWCDGIDKSSWSPTQTGQFLTYLPFTKETWNRASEWLKEREGEYWTRTGANAYQTDCDLPIAIEKLIKHGRPHAAINCLSRMRYSKQPINTDQCVQALLDALSSNEASDAMDEDNIVELIKHLQADPSVNEDDLFKVEWAYLRLLDRHRGAAPQLLENILANDPEFFCEVIRLIYRSNKEDQSQKPTEKSKANAKHAWRLLHEWKTPPGTQKDGTFNEEHFTKWLQDVKASCTESGHLAVALNHIGTVLIHTPEDQNGLWINKVVAKALNDREAEAMRNRFRTGTGNSRGVHWVDPTGKPEKALAEQFRVKAEEAENEGFQRFAVTLRDLANDYDNEAERIISEP
jgi:hypothetical protein